MTLEQARETVEEWRVEYNTVRLHSSLEYMTPEEFIARDLSNTPAHSEVGGED